MKITNPEIEKLLILLSERAPQWREHFAGWEHGLRNAYARVEELKGVKELIAQKEFSNVIESLNGNELEEYLLLVWGDSLFGSIGGGKLGKLDILGSKGEELYNITQQMILSLNENESIGRVYWTSDRVTRGKSHLKAVKLRALAVLSGLRVPSLFNDKHYNVFLSFLGQEGRYPDSGAELLDLLKQYLPKRLQNDPVIAYIFPWVVFEILVLKKEESQWIIGDSSVEKEIVEEEDSIKTKYWWINSLDVFENKVLKVGSEGDLALNLLDSNRRSNFNQLGHSVSHVAFFCAKSLLGSDIFEVELSVSLNSDESIERIAYYVHAVYHVEKTISIFLDSIEGLGERDSIKDLDKTVVELNKAIYEIILGKLILIRIQKGQEEDDEKLSGITGKSHTHRDKNDIDPVLGVKSIAKKLAEQISKLEDEEGQVVGVFGRWGRGKTFLLREMSKVLGFNYDQEFQKYDKNRAFHLVKIHAWKYKEERAFWAYLYESVAEQYYASSWLPILGKLLRIFELNINRLGVWKFLSYLIPLIVSLSWWMTPISCKGEFIEWLIGTEFNVVNIKNVYKAIVSILPLVISAFLFYRNVLPKASKLFTTLSNKHSFKDELGFQAKLQDELRILMKTWIKSVEKKNRKRILIVVDDLDRCELNNIVPIADALRIILEEPDIIKRTIVITLVDEKILMNAISRKYIRLGGSMENREKRAKEYMDKLFLTGIKLPDLLDSEIMDILESITKDQVFVPAKKNRIEKKEIEEDEDGGDGEDYEFEIESRSLPIESKGKIRLGAPNIQVEDIPDKFQITSDEKALLQKYVVDLTNPTPRQLKIFYYRYLLLKLLDQSPEFGLTSKFGRDHFNEFAIYSLVQKGNGIDASDSGHDMDSHILEVLGDKFDDADLKKMESLIEMVVPY